MCQRMTRKDIVPRGKADPVTLVVRDIPFIQVGNDAYPINPYDIDWQI